MNFFAKLSLPLRAGLLGLLLSWLPLLGWGQINLTNSGVYSQDFDGIGGGLPAGIAVVTGATAASLGTAATLVAAGTAANSTNGNFRNVISATDYTSATYPVSSTATTGAGFTNRALALRQTGAFGDPGGAFVFQLANTTGYTGFTASFRLQSLDAGSARATTFRVDYGIGSAPTTFSLPTSTTGTLTTGGSAFSNNLVNVDFGGALDNQAGPVYIRIVALTGSTGSGTRATSAIDDFTLSYTPGAPSSTLVANPAALSGFAATPTTASAAQSFTVGGTNLTPANATVTVSLPGAPDYEVSIDNTNFLGAGNTFTFTAAGGTLASQTLYVRLKAGLAAGSYNGQTLTVSGGGAASQTVTLNGTSGPPATYTWDGSTSTSFKEPTNWTPDRNTLAANDVLIFDKNTTPVATVLMDFAGGNQTIGQLIFRNGIVATLSGSANRILTLGGPAVPANLLVSAADSVVLEPVMHLRPVWRA